MEMLLRQQKLRPQQAAYSGERLGRTELHELKVCKRRKKKKEAVFPPVEARADQDDTSRKNHFEGATFVPFVFQISAVSCLFRRKSLKRESGEKKKPHLISISPIVELH